MNLKSITLKNFKNFDKATYTFSKTNLVQGKNGSGKTTLVVDSLLFCLYGYSNRALAELSTKGKSKSCTVEITIEKEGVDYTIKRSYPTKLSIKKDGVDVPFRNSREAQIYINKLFGNLDYLKRFRMIDNSKGINILEEGKTALKKILLSIQQDKFNNIRDRLLKKKRDREVWNKDKAVVYTCYPSEKRLNIINSSLNKLREEFYKVEREVNNLERDQSTHITKKGQSEGKLETLRWQKGELLKTTTCYACKQELQEEMKQQLLNIKNKEITELNEKLKNVLGILDEYKEITEQAKQSRSIIRQRIDQANILRLKLEARLKQKDYKWTNQDVLIMKKCIEELDKIFAWYIAKWVKVLEPIINSVIEKIGFTIEFCLNQKGDFDIKLYKDGQEYSYQDLSEGQKLMLSIGFKLALLLEKGGNGLIIADEGFSSLDSKNLGYVFNLFEGLPFQLIAIVHRFDNIPININIITLGG